jgi:hypothetical protein
VANTNNPFGFRSFGHMDGSAPTMGLQRYFINSSDTNLYFQGDPVALSSAAAGGVIQPYNGSSLGPICLGVFNGCEFYSPSVARQVWSAYFPGNLGTSSSPCLAYIITDPEMQFKVQVSSAAMGSSWIGLNANILTSQSSLGNTLSGVSNCTLSSTQSPSASSSFPFRIIDMTSNFEPPGANGADNTTSFNTVIVAPNNWARKTLTAVST